MQEVPGQKILDKWLQHPQFKAYKGLFDNTYRTYGNGLLYSTEKFTLVESKNYIIGSNNGKNKRSAFRVVLRHNQTQRSIVLYVTHLDHISEQNRIKQWKAFTDVCDINGDCKRKYVVLGDLNALTQTDYSLQRNLEITAHRRSQKFEDPSSELTDLISNQGYFDAMQHFGTIGPTSRFDTRVDYILFCQRCDVLDGNVGNVRAIDTKDASDHLPVLCDVNETCF